MVMAQFALEVFAYVVVVERFGECGNGIRKWQERLSQLRVKHVLNSATIR